MKWKINHGVLWLKIIYAIYGFGIMIILPFYPLQMASLGLPDEDVGLILGLIPLVVVFTTPIGGFISDVIGFRIVMVIDIIIICISSTSYIWVPRFQRFEKNAFVNISNDTNELLSVHFPVCGQDKVDDTSYESCMNSWPFLHQLEFLDDLSSYLENCDFDDYDLEAKNLTQTNSNGSFCTLANPEVPITDYIICPITNHPNLTMSCDSSFGDYTLTFWTIFGVQLINAVFTNNGWVLWDSISVKEAVRHNSKYTYIIFYTLTAQALAPFVSGFTIKDGDNGLNDYSMAYYVNDGIMALTLILVIWKMGPKQLGQDVQDGDDKKQQSSGLKAFQELLSIPMVILLIGVTTTGLIFGVHGTYLYLYLQRDLGASSKLLSYMNNIAFGCQALFLPIADFAVEKVGYVHSICINIFLEVIKLVVYAYVEQSPPYYALGLHVLNFTLWGYSWVAMLKYGYLITPPHLVGTITAFIMVCQTVICNSIASLGGGQLLGRFGWDIPDLLRLAAVIGLAGGLIYLLAYYLIGKKSEKRLIAKLDKKYPDRWKKLGDGSIPLLSRDYFLELNAKITHF